MNAIDMLTLFGAMAVLAAVPSVSVFAVSARAATSGFLHGVLTALGVVAGDLLFILLAMFGLALLVEALGEVFFLVKYISGAYLVWLGISMWRSRHREAATGAGSGTSLRASFMTGLLITLADQKAILFYLGFLPAFVELAALTYLDVGAVLAIAILAVGGVKIAYAYAASRAGGRAGARSGTLINVLAAGVMVAVGLAVIVTA